MIRTFIDSGVLITAARAIPGPFELAALQLLDDPQRLFLSSPFIRLELEPKAHYHRSYAEAAFYRAFFDSVQDCAPASPSLLERAMDLGRTYGLAAMDALHVAAALDLGAEELITTEAPSKPMFRTQGLRVLNLYA